jgi:hypothetical protein
MVLADNFSILTVIPSTLQSIQTQTINSCLFGALIMMSLWVFYGSYNLWKNDKKKVIFILNLGQAFFYIIKILAVSVYIVFYQLNCSFRPYAINLPQIVCYVLIYTILLKRLLIFSPFQIGKNTERNIPNWVIIAFFSIIMIAYVSTILAGVITSISSLTDVGKCRTVYQLVYRQQYAIEIILEVFFASILIIALTKRSDEIRNRPTNLFQQLRENENIRFFSVFIIITLKIILSYNNLSLGFDVLSLTHFIDSLRSILIYWAIKTEYNKIIMTEKEELLKLKNRNGIVSESSSNGQIGSRRLNNGSRRQDLSI